MKPLKIALIVKGTPATLERLNRNVGYWSYPVPEFTWAHFCIGDNVVPRNKFSNFDLIFMEDVGAKGRLEGEGPPVVFLSIDGTLSPEHQKARQHQAQHADLVLVDHERLENYYPYNNKVRRLVYCVNDGVFGPLEKSLDVCFHCSAGERKGMPGGKERNEIRRMLGDHCRAKGYSYVSGGVGLVEYASHMGRARVVINWPRTPANRPHRVFDAMACASAVLTGPLPSVDGDYRQSGVHYWEFNDHGGMLTMLDELLVGDWVQVSSLGYSLVESHHTWAIRAKELRRILEKELSL